MSTDLVQFHFDTHAIQVQIDEQGNPWWIAQEICAVLDIHDVSKAIARLKPKERRSESRNLLIINESGLYRLIMRSNKPEAERFQDWVFGEVLPTIRKTGTYVAAAPPQLPTPQATLDTLHACRTALQELGCFDDRDTITFAAYVRRIAATAMQPLLPPGSTDPTAPDLSQPVLWTLSMRLQHLKYPPLSGPGGDGQQIRIGTMAKKAYQNAFREEPKKLWDFVRGQQRPVNAYPPDRVHILDAAIAAVLGPPRLQIVTT